MKTTYGTILVLAAAAVVLLASSVPCAGVEKCDGFAWPEGKSEHRFEQADERVNHIMARLAESDPEKAEELAQLREKDPEKFRAELRKLMHKRFGRRFREHMEGRDDKGFGRYREESGRPRMRMTHQRRNECFQWLRKNYPEEAEKLAKLREDKPGLYERHLALGLEKYGRIMRASERHPELAESLKKDLELKEKRDGLLGKIRAASDDKKKELVNQLEDVVGQRFELIVRRKQMKYEMLRKRLERMKERVKKSEAQVEKWKDINFKKENVKARVEALLNETEKFSWE